MKNVSMKFLPVTRYIGSSPYSSCEIIIYPGSHQKLENLFLHSEMLSSYEKTVKIITEVKTLLATTEEGKTIAIRIEDIIKNNTEEESLVREITKDLEIDKNGFLLVKEEDFLLEFAKTKNCSAIYSTAEIIDNFSKDYLELISEDIINLVILPNKTFVTGYFNSFEPYTMPTSIVMSFLEIWRDYLLSQK